MNMFLLRCLTRLGRVWMRSRGVQLGRGGWVHGFPEIKLFRGSVIEIGDNVCLCSLSRFNPLAPSRRMSLITNTPAARIVIQDGCGISNSVLSCHERITIGTNTMIGAECLIMDSDFHGLPLGENRAIRSAPVQIGDHVFIGARAIILKGVNIGRKAVIGAGSVVTGDIPANSVAAGNPARIIRAPPSRPG